jgi:hypothetical protein
MSQLSPHRASLLPENPHATDAAHMEGGRVKLSKDILYALFK